MKTIALLLAWLCILACGFTALVPATGLAQEPGSEVVAPDGEKGIADPEQKPTLMRMLLDGNPLGLVIVLIILLLSVVSTYFIIVHATTITRSRLMPEHVMSELERMLADGEVNSAIAFCHEPENYSLATEVVLAGLQRYQSSEFGFAEYRSAVEEAGEDQVGRLYRKTEVLNVIGSIAPMLGLTGTVVGMIEAFNTIAGREGMARPEELAGGIGQALITTLLGLLVAIPTMVAFSFFRNKIDSLVSEAGKRIERIMSPLGRKKN
ncbi:MAG: MotA/TolQ/ExbB proton channel family protein [Pirellulaceae bacterium]